MLPFSVNVPDEIVSDWACRVLPISMSPTACRSMFFVALTIPSRTIELALSAWMLSPAVRDPPTASVNVPRKSIDFALIFPFSVTVVASAENLFPAERSKVEIVLFAFSVTSVAALTGPTRLILPPAFTFRCPLNVKDPCAERSRSPPGCRSTSRAVIAAPIFSFCASIVRWFAEIVWFTKTSFVAVRETSLPEIAPSSVMPPLFALIFESALLVRLAPTSKRKSPIDLKSKDFTTALSLTTIADVPGTVARPLTFMSAVDALIKPSS